MKNRNKIIFVIMLVVISFLNLFFSKVFLPLDFKGELFSKKTINKEETKDYKKECNISGVVEQCDKTYYYWFPFDLKNNTIYFVNPFDIEKSKKIIFLKNSNDKIGMWLLFSYLFFSRLFVYILLTIISVSFFSSFIGYMYYLIKS